MFTVSSGGIGVGMGEGGGRKMGGGSGKGLLPINPCHSPPPPSGSFSLPPPPSPPQFPLNWQWTYQQSFRATSHQVFRHHNNHQFDCGNPYTKVWPQLLPWAGSSRKKCQPLLWNSLSFPGCWKHADYPLNDKPLFLSLPPTITDQAAPYPDLLAISTFTL